MLIYINWKKWNKIHIHASNTIKTYFDVRHFRPNLVVFAATLRRLCGPQKCVWRAAKGLANKFINEDNTTPLTNETKQTGLLLFPPEVPRSRRTEYGCISRENDEKSVGIK